VRILKNKAGDYSNIEKMLLSADVGERKHKNNIRNRVMFKAAFGQPEHENEYQQPVRNYRRISTAAACVLLVAALFAALSTTAFAQDLIENVLAYFKIGNFEIVQYDHLPDVNVLPDDNKDTDSEDGMKQGSVADAYMTLDTEFMLPKRLPKGYQYTRCLIYNDAMVSVQYTAENDDSGFNQLSILITDQKKSSTNGIDTTGVVKTEEIDGLTVYYVNGIFIWLIGDLQYELYWPDYNPDIDMNSVREIIESLEIV
jgi:hypothetical protein